MLYHYERRPWIGRPFLESHLFQGGFPVLMSILFFTLLLVLSGLFSSLETAFPSLTPYDVEDLEQNHGRSGRIVKKLSEKPHILLTTLLLGNNLVNIRASALAAEITMDLLGSQFISYMTGLLTLVVLIFCEVTPKQIALAANRSLALRLSGLVLFLSWLFRPFIWMITGVSNFLTSLFVKQDRSLFTLDNLLQMVKMGENMGIVETYENQMVKNVFRINDTPVQAIMTHRTETYCLDRESVSTQIHEDILEKGVTRIPLYKDEPENIVGILLVKDYLRAYSQRKESFPLKELEQPPLYIPRNSKVNELFNLFKKEKLNIAIVLDEYGGLDGVVTVHDVVQEIFGSLDDEDHNPEPEKITPIGKGWRIMGDADFYDIQDALGMELDHNKDILTISGFLTEKLGHLPERGEEVELAEGLFQIEKTENNRILSILFHKNEKDPSVP